MDQEAHGAGRSVSRPPASWNWPAVRCQAALHGKVVLPHIERRYWADLAEEAARVGLVVRVAGDVLELEL